MCTLTKVTYLPIEDGNADVKLFESGENDYGVPAAAWHL
jgi:ABC-type oligopeptide transport system substrate-binding subunit